MDRSEARRVLGVEPTASTAEIRSAFRAAIRRHHPDVAPAADAGIRVARVTEAYELLLRSAADPPETPPFADATTTESAAITLMGTDTIVLPAPPPEAFARLLDAAHALGYVSYIDRSSGFLEAVVNVVDGPSCSLVVSLQGRATGTTEAFVTIEPLGQGAAPPVEPFTAALAGLVAQRWT